jgi:hypothetical protein
MSTPTEQTLRAAWPVGRRNLRRPVPDLSALPPAEAQHVREQLAKLDRACGCDLGALVALGALALYVAAVVVARDRIGGSLGVRIGVGVAVFIIGAGIGKTLGLMRVRNRRNRLLDQIESQLLTRSGPR